MITHQLYEHRDREFIRVCRSLMTSSRAEEIKSLRMLAREALANGAPRYYVDIDFAYRRIQRIGRKAVMPRRCMTRMMWEEIMGKVETLRATRPELSLLKTVTEILVREPASSFFIEENCAVRILQKYNRTNKHNRFYFKP